MEVQHNATQAARCARTRDDQPPTLLNTCQIERSTASLSDDQSRPLNTEQRQRAKQRHRRRSLNTGQSEVCVGKELCVAGCPNVGDTGRASWIGIGEGPADRHQCVGICKVLCDVHQYQRRVELINTSSSACRRSQEACRRGTQTARGAQVLLLGQQEQIAHCRRRQPHAAAGKGCERKAVERPPDAVVKDWPT